MNPLEIPKLEKYVNDQSGVLPPGDIEGLNELFAIHEKNTTEQVVVVLFPQREGNELLDIGLKIFNENGIGQKGQNNGLLLIIATEEKKIRLITGKGMEIKYSEMRCRTIIEDHLRPLLNQGKYRELLTTFSSIIKEVGESEPPNPQIVKGKETTKLIAGMSGIASVISLFFASGIFSGAISLSLGLIFFIAIWHSKHLEYLKIGFFAYFFSGCLICFGLIGILQPTNCILVFEDTMGGRSYQCTRKIVALEYTYHKYVGGILSHSSSYGNSSDWGNGSSSSSDWDSGGSSFGGGGGSSNGGGYGD